MKRMSLLVLGLVLLGVVGFWGLKRSGIPRAARSDQSRDTTVGQIKPVPARAIASVEATPKRLATVLKDDEIGRSLTEGFNLAREGNTPNRGALNSYLAKLDRRPDFARHAITTGLDRLPKSAEFADQRAGLIDLIPRFAPGNVAWAAGQLEKELTEVPSEPRPRTNEAKTEAERDLALSVTPDIARSQIAFENLISVQKADCGALEGSVGRIVAAQRDQVLRQNFERRFKFTCPSSTLAFSTGEQ